MKLLSLRKLKADFVHSTLKQTTMNREWDVGYIHMCTNYEWSNPSTRKIIIKILLACRIQTFKNATKHRTNSSTDNVKSEKNIFDWLRQEQEWNERRRKRDIQRAVDTIDWHLSFSMVHFYVRTRQNWNSLP